MDVKGFETRCKGGLFTASFENSVYFVAHRGSQGMFCLALNNKSKGDFYTCASGIMMWHKRLGHVNNDRLREMKRKGIVKGIEFKDDEIMESCSGCAQGKLHKLPFPKTATFRGEKVLDLIHTDLWGPARVTSAGGKRYMLTITDDYSRFSKVYFLHSKTQVFEYFIEYKNWSERLHETKIKRVRSDNGGEFTSNEFEEYLRTEGIQHQKTVPYNPEQNGVAERLNRTLGDMARCMLNDKKIGLEF